MTPREALDQIEREGFSRTLVAELIRAEVSPTQYVDTLRYLVMCEEKKK